MQTSIQEHFASSLACLDELPQVEKMMLNLVHSGKNQRADAMIDSHFSMGGKRLRARLSLAASKALCVTQELAIPWAAAVEYLHNASLIHDDLQDNDRIRRDGPTLWSQYGKAQAINAGDLLLLTTIKAVSCIDVSTELRWSLLQALNARAITTLHGQCEDLALLERNDVDWHRFLQVIGNKTGQLLALPFEGAALLGGFTEHQAQALGNLVVPLGAAFQLQNDLSDLRGDSGRRSGADFFAGRLNALTIAHFEARPKDRNWICELLRNLPLNEANHARILHAIHTGDAASIVRKNLENMVSTALNVAEWTKYPTIRPLVTWLGQYATKTAQKGSLQ